MIRFLVLFLSQIAFARMQSFDQFKFAQKWWLPTHNTQYFRTLSEGFYSPHYLWPNRYISVCWDNGSPLTQYQQSWVKNRVTETWEAQSGLEFIGWDNCSITGKSDIQITIADTGPHTKGLGKLLKNQTSGMVLNFSFKNWSTICQNGQETYRRCIESIAIHEFGHALGLTHEHNRSDRDADCTIDPQGVAVGSTIGQFDRDSIMNYCYGSSYRNKLSLGDINAIQMLYGRNIPPAPIPDPNLPPPTPIPPVDPDTPPTPPTPPRPLPPTPNPPPEPPRPLPPTPPRPLPPRPTPPPPPPPPPPRVPQGPQKLNSFNLRKRRFWYNGYPRARYKYFFIKAMSNSRVKTRNYFYVVCADGTQYRYWMPAYLYGRWDNPWRSQLFPNECPDRRVRLLTMSARAWGLRNWRGVLEFWGIY